MGVLLGVFLCQPSLARPLHLVAAENFYGVLAKEIGGADVQVESILKQPDQDPHLFNVNPHIARSIAQADIIVFNGLGYDSWMEGLLSAHINPTRTLINVGKLLNKKEGDNPHIWYDPMTMPVYAKALLDYLSKKDPAHSALYEKNYRQFLENFHPLTRLIDELRPRTTNINVIATEPVFGYMAQALGFTMQGIDFQISMMNGVDPSPRQIIDFQQQLQTRRVKILFYNQQVNSALIQQLLKVAKSYSIPVVGVTETQPPNETYIQWMTHQLKQIEMVLNEHHPV